MKYPYLAIVATLLLLGACAGNSEGDVTTVSVALRPDMLESPPIVPGDNSKPKVVGVSKTGLLVYSPPAMCVHVKSHHNGWGVYAEGYVEVWVTQGTCAEKRTQPYFVQEIQLEWSLSSGVQASRTCKNVSMCAHDERAYGNASAKIACTRLRVKHYDIGVVDAYPRGCKF